MPNFYVSHKRVKVLTGVFSWGSPASRFALFRRACWRCRRRCGKAKVASQLALPSATRHAGPNDALPCSRERAGAGPSQRLEPGFEADGCRDPAQGPPKSPPTLPHSFTLSDSASARGRNRGDKERSSDEIARRMGCRLLSGAGCHGRKRTRRRALRVPLCKSRRISTIPITRRWHRGGRSAAATGWPSCRRTKSLQVMREAGFLPTGVPRLRGFTYVINGDRPPRRRRPTDGRCADRRDRQLRAIGRLRRRHDRPVGWSLWAARRARHCRRRRCRRRRMSRGRRPRSRALRAARCPSPCHGRPPRLTSRSAARPARRAADCRQARGLAQPPQQPAASEPKPAACDRSRCAAAGTAPTVGQAKPAARHRRSCRPSRCRGAGSGILTISGSQKAPNGGSRSRKAPRFCRGVFISASVCRSGRGARAARGSSLGQKNAPVARGVVKFRGGLKSECDQAAAFSAEPSTTRRGGAPAEIGIERGFLASGISRTRSTWSRPCSREAFFTTTKSASWNARSKARAAMPR